MNRIASLLFEARMLKEIPRSGFQFLGAGRESVAEHVHMMSFIAMVLAKTASDLDLGKLLSMCLLHDLPEARIGDLNAVQKNYVRADEQKAVSDLAEPLPFGAEFIRLMTEYNQGDTAESKIARDADQLAFILELKSLSDIGYATPDKWIDHVIGRVKTDAGKALAQSILDTEWDHWWLKEFQMPPSAVTGRSRDR